MGKQLLKAERWKEELDLVIESIRAARKDELAGYGIRKTDPEEEALRLVKEANEILTYVLNATKNSPNALRDDRSMLIHHTKRVAVKAAFVMQLLKNGEA